MAKLFHLQHLFSFVIKAAYQVSENNGKCRYVKVLILHLEILLQI